jgi:hypothetical protein
MEWLLKWGRDFPIIIGKNDQEGSKNGITDLQTCLFF